jgi:bifunctional non-homologous end joining protein LigD
MALEEYRRKRRFAKTPEPAGKGARPGGDQFVVQKHAARRLHYDFRLALNGVLKSWAVPKGPSLDPADKRLAVQTEDHPLDYANFEGIIPEGNYGAGTVMVWDCGAYRVEGEASAAQQLARGELKFSLDGQKLRGSFVLVKLRRSEKGNEWLLIKHKDAAAEPGWNVDQHDGSALTGRTLEEIREGMSAAHAARGPRPEELEGAAKAEMPARLNPMLATLAEKPFSHPEWLFEIKWDGVRSLAWVKEGRVEYRSRNGRSITDQYSELAALPECLNAKRAILDGEIVVLGADGRSDFERLQERMHVARPPVALQKRAPVTYYLFDVLFCDGYDLRSVPLAERKQFLRQILRPRDPFRYSDHHVGQGKELFELARSHGLEGILGKHARSVYVSQRSPHWLKFKVRREVDAVVGGWTEPRGSREHFGALLLGLYDGKALQFIGGVGSGFTEHAQKEIAQQLKALARKRCPFAAVPETKEKAAWAEPSLVVRVEHGGWTGERRLRQPVFLGVRAELSPEECRLESEAPATAAPAVVTAAAVAGRLLARTRDIEAELFRGRADQVTIELDGRRLRLTHLNKVYFPLPGYTKRDLLAYYFRMAERILPYLRERPLVLRRYPDGISGESFFQKDAGEAAPGWMTTTGVYSDERRQEIRYFVANDLTALLYLVNLGCIDHNPWFSRVDDLAHPDYIAFDLDPTEGTAFPTVVEVARAVLAKLESLGLEVFVKTSGATGIHLFVPVERRYTYEQVRTFAEIVARLVAAEAPKHVSQERSVAKRPRGTVYIDVFQNAEGRPLAAAYAVRAFPKAPVSTPLAHAELRRSLRPEQFNLKSIFARIEKRADPWAKFWTRRQRLEKATQALTQHLASRGKR